VGFKNSKCVSIFCVGIVIFWGVLKFQNGLVVFCVGIVIFLGVLKIQNGLLFCLKILVFLGF
jgi:hypothetical protein